MRDKVNVTWSYQLWRLRFRAYVMAQAFLTALFWFAVLVISGALNQYGLGSIAWIVVSVWLFFGIPGLLFQVQTIADITSYIFTGRTTFYPAILERVKSGETERQFNQLPPNVRRFILRILPVVGFAADVSPLSAIASWGSIVLARLPSVAHQPAPPPARYVTFAIAREEHKRLEAIVFEDIVERLLGSRLPTAA
jgi:hypothetical protein